MALAIRHCCWNVAPSCESYEESASDMKRQPPVQDSLSHFVASVVLEAREGANQRGLHVPRRDCVESVIYAALLKYFDSTGAVVGDWTPFFNSDVSALLAVPGP